jgi:hypothetical protein
MLAIAAPALAIHVFNPPWVVNPNDPQWAGGSTTSADWEFGGGGLAFDHPVAVNNPFGTQQPISWVGASPTFVPVGPQGPFSGVWQIGDTGPGSFSIPIWNDPIERPRKVIHLQYTSDKSSTAPPSTNPPGTASAGGVAGHGGAWYTYEWTIVIQPNPPFEVVTVPFPAGTNIEEIHVATICVPEPAGLLSAAAAGLALLRRRRAMG